MAHLQALRRSRAVPISRLSSSSTSSRRGLATAVSSPSPQYASRLPPYADLLKNLELVKSILNRPLTLAEKILYSHLTNPEESLHGVGKDPSEIRGKKYLSLKLDRLAMQDASAQMALLQFMTCGLDRVSIPSSVHCDHLIQAFEGAEADLKRSVASNQEVFNFLESACKKYGIEFWGPGSGIIHQIVLENYAAPGLLMLGTDSHTPNASGLGCLAIGVGGADAVDAMTSTPWELMAPKTLGVKLTGSLSPWCTPKDVILHLVGRLTVRGGTGRIVEYLGEGLKTLPATGLATMSNMGAEIGATTSAFEYTSEMGKYLDGTNRQYVRLEAEKASEAGLLRRDSDSEYDEFIEIKLDDLEPCLNGPFTPDLSTPLSQFVNKARSSDRDHPLELSAALIGSCTNSSYADMSRCADLAKQAQDKGLKVKTSFDITPGSELVRATIERDGMTEIFESVGGRVLANACGPCIGQWDRRELKGEDNVILTSFNRNFKGRNDGNSKTMNMLASPEIVTAMAFAGRLDFNPITDSLQLPDGSSFKFNPPSGDTLPSNGFIAGNTSYLPDIEPEPQREVQVDIKSDSLRLQYLEPFDSPFKGNGKNGEDELELSNLRCLMRIRGKCTTDHISAAGPWLKYKGHLGNLAENTLIGAMNDESGNVNEAFDLSSSGGSIDTIPSVAKLWKSRSQPWMLVADHNYGEGSAREHAALQPRFYGCNLIVARSIARIAETNLRKQGVLTLLFANEDDYLKISSGDLVETMGLKELLKESPELEKQVTLKVTKFEQDGKTVKEVIEIPTKHSLSKAHLSWIKEGSALNLIRNSAAKPTSSSVGPSSPSGTRSMSTSARPTINKSSSIPSRRSYATAAKVSPARLNPNDPNYVPPAADSRTDAIRQIVYPPSSTLPANLPTDISQVLGHPKEVHETITRAWLLFKRQERETLAENLRVKRQMMYEACEDLKKEDPSLFASASYKVNSNKRHPEEDLKLRKLGLLPNLNQSSKSSTDESSGEKLEGIPQLSGPEIRRRLRAISGRRLHGLFPREMRVPTSTPAKIPFPKYVMTEEEKI